MSMKVSTLSDLAHLIRAEAPGLIAIDGYQGAGKSTLARKLERQLGIRCVHLDSFLVPNRGTFVQSLRLPELSGALQEHPVLIEGVCLLTVMKHLRVKPDMFVYIKTAEPHPGTALGTGPFADEVRSYHRQCRPIDIADVVYTASDPAKGGSFVNSRRADIDIAFIQAKTRLAIALAIGGMIALVVGLAVLLYGVTGQDHTLVKAANVEVSASGLGAVIMTTSVLWAFFSYKCRPIYSQIHQSSEVYGSDGSILERREYLSATQRAVGPSDAIMEQIFDRRKPPAS
jgi:hypothetical protein